MKSRAKKISITIGVVLALLIGTGVGLGMTYRHHRRVPEFASIKMIQTANRLPQFLKKTWLLDPLRHYITHLMRSGMPIGVSDYLAENQRADYLVVVIGDSVTANALVAKNRRWPDHLEKLIAYHMPGKRVRVVNAGIPGNNIVAVARRFARDVGHLHPDLVIFSVGFNDAVIIADAEDHTESLVPLPVFRDTWFKIAEGMKQHLHGKQMFWTPIPVAASHQPVIGPEYLDQQIAVIEQYRAVAKEASEKYGVPLADVYEQWRAHPLADQAHLPDGIHPNALGNLIIAKAIYDKWREIEGIPSAGNFIEVFQKATAQK